MKSIRSKVDAIITKNQNKVDAIITKNQNKVDAIITSIFHITVK